MELKHFRCPNCGAILKINQDNIEAKCDYCGQQFVVDNMNSMINDAINETMTEIINERVEEANKHNKSNKTKIALIIGVAALVGIISIGMIILAIVSPDVLANT